jgi:hypothetical protein
VFTSAKRQGIDDCCPAPDAIRVGRADAGQFHQAVKRYGVPEIGPIGAQTP